MLLNRTIIICLGAGVLAGSGLVSELSAQTPVQQRSRTMILHRMADRGYLGVGVIELTDDRVKALNLKDDNGVEVKRVEENSAAAKAGLKTNDVILEVNGRTVEDMDQFIRWIGELPAGAKVNLTIWRNGAKQNLAATLDSRPGNAMFAFPEGAMPPIPPMPPMPSGDDNGFSGLLGSSPRVGFEGETLSAQLAAYFGVREGVLVRTVEQGTPAEKAGLKAGDVVTKVNGTPVTNPREISGLVRMNRGKSASFTVMRNKKEMTLNVQITARRWTASPGDAL